MIKAIIFDLDGVVIDSEPLWFESRKKFLEKRGIHLTPEIDVSKKAVNQKDSMLFSKKHYNLQGKVDDLIKERLNMLLEVYEKGIPLMDGFIPLVEKIRKNNIKIALASSSPMHIIEYVMKKLSLKEYFDVIVSSDFVSKGKPAPDIFLYTAKKLEIQPEECVVIEDSENGVEAAKNAGMKCIGFVNKDSGDQGLSKADLIIDDLSELSLDKIQNL